jgi:hypothetical protein
MYASHPHIEGKKIFLTVRSEGAGSHASALLEEMTHLRLDLGESLGIVAEVLWHWMATASASAAAIRIAERFHRRRD